MTAETVHLTLMCVGCRGQRTPELPAFILPGGVLPPRVKAAGENTGIFTRELADLVKGTLKSIGEKRRVKLVAWGATPGFAVALLEHAQTLENLHQVLSQTAGRRAVEAGIWPKHRRLLASRVRTCRVDPDDRDAAVRRLKSIGF